MSYSSSQRAREAAYGPSDDAPDVSGERTWASFVCGDSFFITPGQIKAHAKVALTDLQTLASDVAKSTVDESFKQAFTDFFRTSQKLLNDIIGSTLTRMFAGTDDLVTDQVKRFQEFRDKFKAAGGVPSAPEHVPIKEKGLIEELKPVLIVGGIVGILWGASKLATAATGFRKAAPKALPQRR
jgi:hypothetical protein